MSNSADLFDMSRLKVLPLSRRKNLLSADETIVDPDSRPAALSDAQSQLLQQAAHDIEQARRKGAAAMLIYGAHLLKNGAARIVDRLLEHWLADAPGNQRRRFHSRLGIRLARHD